MSHNHFSVFLLDLSPRFYTLGFSSSLPKGPRVLGGRQLVFSGVTSCHFALPRIPPTLGATAAAPVSAFPEVSPAVITVAFSGILQTVERVLFL